MYFPKFYILSGQYKQFSSVFLVFILTVLPWLQFVDSKRYHIQWLHFHFWVASEKTQYLRDIQKNVNTKVDYLYLIINSDISTVQSLKQKRRNRSPGRISFQHQTAGFSDPSHCLSGCTHHSRALQAEL